MENMVMTMRLDELRSVYANKRVFLTGHTGFKGAWLLSWLHLLGAKIKGYALEPENNECIYNCIEGDDLCQSVIADIRSAETLKKEILDFEPDFIFHLAAQPLVRLSYEIPAETFAVNAIGTANLLDAVRLLKKACSVVLITTDKVYDNKEWLYPYRENDRLGGYDPYSASKACAELIIDSFKRSFFNPADSLTHCKGIASARAGNVIGGGDWSKDRIIPDVVRALSAGEDVQVRNPLSIRPWQHVLEPLYGYLLLGARLAEDPVKYGQAYNFGPRLDDTLPVEELVKIAVRSWGHGSYHAVTQSGQPHEAATLKLDISKAAAELGWYPRLSSKTAISWTIDWYKLPDKMMRKRFTFEQIKKYDLDEL